METRNKKDFIDELRTACAVSQKRGLHFMAASVVIWIGVLAVSLTALPVMTKNLLTFCIAAPLMPLAYLISKPLGIIFSDKSDPLSLLGILFSLGQMLYILITMWVFSAVPEKMLMVYAMIFGAHLLPFGWLYRSKTYYIMSGIDTLAALAIGCTLGRTAVAVFMLVSQICVCFMLTAENRAGKRDRA